MPFHVESPSGAVPAVELAQEEPHDGDHSLLSRHGLALVVVVFAVEALAAHQG